eukprot:scaffold514748_cov41-Prasinocladus_malaysianus.AAC.1
MTVDVARLRPVQRDRLLRYHHGRRIHQDLLQAKTPSLTTVPIGVSSRFRALMESPRSVEAT